MGSPYSVQLHNTVAWLFSLVATEAYEQLETLYLAAEPGSRYIEREINEYPAHFAMPPNEEIDNLISLVERVSYPVPVPSWLVDIDLWTLEEGRSDLTLQVMLADKGLDLYEVTIRTLHVL